MEHLTHLSLFRLLSSPAGSNDDREKLEEAYEEFIKGTLNLSQTGDDIFSIIREMNYARIEFITLRSSGLSGKEDACKKNLAYESHPLSGRGTETPLFAG